MTKSPARTMEGMVAVVAGATRGAGRGIARALGEAGAIVYCTGRSVRGNPSPYGRRETIEETAEMITAAGGSAVAVRVDHTQESEVRELFARVERECGRVDLVADSVAGEDPILGNWGSFWKADLTNGDTALRQSVLSHVITAKHAAALMVKRKRGLIVQVTENDLLFSGGGILAQFAKFSHKALASIWAAELRQHGVASIAITPGFLRSESMLERFGVTEKNWRDGGKKDVNFLESESPLFVGRAIVALAQDPLLLEQSGQLFSSWEVARKYGITDVDGRRPDWGMLDIDYSQVPASLMEAIHDATVMHLAWLKVLLKRTDQFHAKFTAKTKPRSRVRKTARSAKA